MKIVVAPDKFKGSLSAKEAALAIERGIRKILPQAEVILCPVADGGEGTVEVLVAATEGKIIRKEVIGPLGQKVQAYFGVLGSKPAPQLRGSGRKPEECSRAVAKAAMARRRLRPAAVIEMAAASGLHLVPESQRNPLLTTTYGTGELIKAALDYGAGEIVVGIGGSATTDGGMGMAQALGVKFLDEKGKELGPGGGELKRLARIDLSGLDPRVRMSRFLVASDVNNPLYGPEGAAYIYAPQKGASAEDIKELDEGLRNFARVIGRDLNKDIANFPGAGAAGGLGAGLKAFLNADFKRGVDFVIKATGIEEKLEEADLVITGEGKIDAQTARGKAPVGVATLAKEKGIPVVAIGGQVSSDAKAVYNYGITETFSLIDLSSSLEESIEKAAFFLEKTSERVVERFKRGRLPPLSV